MRSLRRVLGPMYGGPSISYEDGQWMLYVWSDAPVSTVILVCAPTWVEFLERVGEFYREKERKR